MKLKEILNKEKKETKAEVELEKTEEVNITYGDEETEAKEFEIKEESNNMKKRTRKKFKIDLPIIIFIILVILILGLVLYLTVGQGGNKYGSRLKGIDKISFTKKDKNKFVEAIKSSDKVNSASIDIQGKLIYIMADFKEDVSADDAKAVIDEALGSLSDKVKGFYDINALITKKDEKATETTEIDNDGKEVKKEHRVFPISGYKNNDSDHIVWENR